MADGKKDDLTHGEQSGCAIVIVRILGNARQHKAQGYTRLTRHVSFAFICRINSEQRELAPTKPLGHVAKGWPVVLIAHVRRMGSVSRDTPRATQETAWSAAYCTAVAYCTAYRKQEHRSIAGQPDGVKHSVPMNSEVIMQRILWATQLPFSEVLNHL